MDALKLLTSLTKEQQLDMRMKGLSPLNPADVKKYKSGQRITEAEKIERSKTLFGPTANMGGRGEPEIDMSRYEGRPYEPAETPAAPTETNYRQQMNEDMSGYVKRTEKVFDTGDMMSLARPQQQPQTVNADDIQLTGFELSKKYLNAFIINLQAPNSQNRMALYKALFACLKEEEKYKANQPLLQVFRSGVEKAEKAMLQKLQGE